jgi:hypothetical protein
VERLVFFGVALACRFGFAAFVEDFFRLRFGVGSGMGAAFFFDVRARGAGSRACAVAVFFAFFFFVGTPVRRSAFFSTVRTYSSQNVVREGLGMTLHAPFSTAGRLSPPM